MNTPPNTNDPFEHSLPLLPLRSGIVLPGSVVTLPVGRRRSRALAEAVPVDGLIAVAVQKDASNQEPGLDDLYPVAVLARVRQKTERGDRGVLLLVEGVSRFSIVELLGREPYMRVRGAVPHEINENSEAAIALADSLRRQLSAEHGQSDRAFAQMLHQTVEPGRLADRLAVWVDAPHD